MGPLCSPSKAGRPAEAMYSLLTSHLNCLCLMICSPRCCVQQVDLMGLRRSSANHRAVSTCRWTRVPLGKRPWIEFPYRVLPPLLVSLRVAWHWLGGVAEYSAQLTGARTGSAF